MEKTEGQLVTELVTEYRQLEEHVATLEAKTKGLKERMDAISHGEIPRALAKAGISKLTTQDGIAVSIKQDVFCSISKTDLQSRERAFQWLRENGGEGIISDNVIVANMTDEDRQALASRYVVERKQDVNAQSLKAFMRRGLGITEGAIVQFAEDDVPTDIHLYTTPVTVMKRA